MEDGKSAHHLLLALNGRGSEADIAIRWSRSTLRSSEHGSGTCPKLKHRSFDPYRTCWSNLYPIERHLKGNRRVRFDFTPASSVAIPGLDPADTASFKLRVDYVLPSRDIEIVGGEVWRHVPEGAATFPSDHFPVYLDVKVPSPTPPAR